MAAASASASTPAATKLSVAATDPRKRIKHHLYSRQMLSRTFVLPAWMIGAPVMRGLADEARKLEGKCAAEGLVRSGSTTIASHSAGVCENGKVVYNVKIECDICSPVPGQRINKCTIAGITKAGIRAFKAPAPGPVEIFIPRDHYGGSEYYSSLKEGDEIDVVVTAPRFQLNSRSVTVLADLLPKRPYTRLVIQPN